MLSRWAVRSSVTRVAPPPLAALTVTIGNVTIRNMPKGVRRTRAVVVQAARGAPRWVAPGGAGAAGVAQPSAIVDAGAPTKPGSAADDRDARRAARRAELVDAAIAVVRRDGPGASMDRMAAEAGVTKPILYRHFGDRAGLVAAIAEHAFALVSGALDRALAADATPRELVTATIDAYLSFIESDADLYRFLVHRTISETADPSAVLNDYLWRVGRRIALVLGEGLRAAGLDSGPAEPWAFALVGMVHATGDWWLERGTLPRSRVTQYLTTLACDGLPNLDAAGTTGTWLAAEDAARAGGDTSPGTLHTAVVPTPRRQRRRPEPRDDPRDDRAAGSTVAPMRRRSS